MTGLYCVAEQFKSQVWMSINTNLLPGNTTSIYVFVAPTVDSVETFSWAPLLAEELG